MKDILLSRGPTGKTECQKAFEAWKMEAWKDSPYTPDHLRMFHHDIMGDVSIGYLDEETAHDWLSWKACWIRHVEAV